MRVLQIVDSLDMGGIQTFLLNLNRAIDLEKDQFDYLVFRSHEQVLEKEFKALGAKIYKLPNWRQGIVKNRKALHSFFAEHKEYKVIHYHAGTLVDVGPLIEAKKAGINVRVMHSHNTHAGGIYLNTIIHKIHKKCICDLATHYFACGLMAAKWMFDGTKASELVTIVNNGIDTKLYAFNEKNRIAKRKELNAQDKILIGHVGRFTQEKNQGFLVNVIKEITKYEDKVKLIFVGDGVDRTKVEECVHSLQLDDRIQFLGIRKDVDELLQAMDVFVLPSLFEGFPLVLVEAQAAGVPCVISDSISKEVAINDNVVMMSLDDSEENWAKTLLNPKERIYSAERLRKAGFDITDTANKIVQFYNSAVVDGD